MFAGRAVLHVEHFPAPKQGVFRFHNWLSLFRDTSPVSTAIVNARCGEVSASSRADKEKLEPARSADFWPWASGADHRPLPKEHPRHWGCDRGETKPKTKKTASASRF